MPPIQHSPSARPAAPGGGFRPVVLLISCALLLLNAFTGAPARAAGVTLITHGFEGDVTGWINNMANAIPPYFHAKHPGFSTNFTIYTVTLTTDGKNYYFQSQRDAGSAPFSTDTGEIIIELDWTQMAGSPYDISTYQVAAIASQVLLLTNSITELNGHALVEYPLHLIGHSRGGSLVSQISFVLGTNGVWVDHLTTLDPYPFNNDGKPFPGGPTDASATNSYENILFSDNYWQDQGAGFDPHGEAVPAAYVRQLSATELTEGYHTTSDLAPDHSNVHLWYYGTINLNTPNTNNDDGEVVVIDATMRQNWWVTNELAGQTAGFYYSLIGGGNRLSTAIPLGLPGDPAIVSGYNQFWNLGGGTNANRKALPMNNGTWPNIIKLDIVGTNSVAQNAPLAAGLYYQYGGTSNLTLQFFLDADLNPYNSNSIPLLTLTPPATGTNAVNSYQSLGLATTNVPAGAYSVYAKISDGTHSRYLYAPEWVQVTVSPAPPTVDIRNAGGGQVVIGINGVVGQRLILQSSSDLKQWWGVATNTLTTSRWLYTNSVAGTRQFYRAQLGQ